MTLPCPDCSGYLFQQTPVVAGRVLEDRTVYGCLCCGHTMLELPTTSRMDREEPTHDRADAVGAVGGGLVQVASGLEDIPLGGGPGAADGGGAA